MIKTMKNRVIRVGVYYAAITKSVDAIRVEIREDAISLIHEAIVDYERSIDAISQNDAWDRAQTFPQIIYEYEDDGFGKQYLFYVIHRYEAELYEPRRWSVDHRLEQQGMTFMKLFAGDFYYSEKVENSRFEEKLERYIPSGKEGR